MSSPSSNSHQFSQLPKFISLKDRTSYLYSSIEARAPDINFSIITLTVLT